MQPEQKSWPLVFIPPYMYSIFVLVSRFVFQPGWVSDVFFMVPGCWKKIKELPGSGFLKTCVDGYEPGVVFWSLVKPDIYQGS